MSETIKYQMPNGSILSHEVRNAGATVGVISSVDGKEGVPATFPTMDEARQSITDAMAEFGGKRVHTLDVPINQESHETRVAVLVTRMIEWDGKVLDTWRANFDQDAHHSMSWSTRAFASVANVYVATHVLERLEAGDTCEAIAVNLQREINRKAEDPARSTSIPSNLLESDDNAARVKMLKLLAE